MEQPTSVFGNLDCRDPMKYVEEVVSKSTDDAEKSQWRKNDAKARKIIIYYVRDHLILHISNLKTTKQMYDALKNLFESNNTNIALALRPPASKSQDESLI